MRMCTDRQILVQHAPYPANDVKESSNSDIFDAFHVSSGSTQIAAVEKSPKAAQCSYDARVPALQCISL